MIGLRGVPYVLALVALHFPVAAAGKGVRNIRSHAEYKKFLKVCVPMYDTIFTGTKLDIS